MDTARERNRNRLAALAPMAAVIGLFVLLLSTISFVDPDLWHEMALFREAANQGRLPQDDCFAYTPTVSPSVHHEWGTGAVLYGVTSLFGWGGLMGLKYLLTAVVAVACCRCALGRGARPMAIVALAPVAILGGIIGFTTVRAQLFTLAFLAIELCLLEADRRGDRRWMWIWLPLYVAWVNLHAGFVVGFGLLVFHAIEERLRGHNVRHLVRLLLAMIALVAVNPYGVDYYRYLSHALLMRRPLISEWAPLWQTDPAIFRLYVMSLLLVAYCAAVIGPRRMPGLLVLAVTAYVAGRHTRHISLYLVAWLCYMPGWFDQTPLGSILADFWTRRRPLVVGGSLLILLACLVKAVPAAPWRAHLPVHSEDERQGLPVYPVGAVQYLDEIGFRGNLMVPFVPGGYVIWKLHPNVRVSIDGRYEVAYQPGMLEENTALYEAKPGWQATLAKYPTHAVLVPRSSALTSAIAGSDWQRFYRDEAFDLYARPGSQMPPADRSNQPLPSTLP